MKAKRSEVTKSDISRVMSHFGQLAGGKPKTVTPARIAQLEKMRATRAGLIAARRMEKQKRIAKMREQKK